MAEQLWPRAKHPLGFHVGECWGNILDFPKNHSAATEAAYHVYTNGGPGGESMIPRLMVKTYELELDPEALGKAYDRIERAMSYGCEIELVLDWFMPTHNRQGYHAQIYWPEQRTLAQHTRDLVRRFRPAEFEACNEFWYTKGNQDTSMLEYTGKVHQIADGILMAGGDGPQLNASIRLDPRDSAHDLWVWQVPYGNCAEVQHDFILDQHNDQPRNARELAVYLEARAYAQRGKAVGWVFPLKINETTFNGAHVNLDSVEGTKMVEVSLAHYQKYRLPATFLAMGGFKEFDDGGQWQLQVDFVDQHGNLAKGVERWLEIVGGDPYVGPDPDPDQKPGRRHIRAAIDHLDKSLVRWDRDGGPRQANMAINRIERGLEARD